MVPFFLIFSDWAFLALRLALGVIFIAHGLPKLKNLEGTSGWFASIGFKPGKFWATVVGIAEFAGGIFLIAGFLTQVAAAALTLQFIVIMIWRLKRKDKLVSAAGGQGYEFDLALLAALFTLVTVGSTLFSLDSYFGWTLPY